MIRTTSEGYEYEGNACDVLAEITGIACTFLMNMSKEANVTNENSLGFFVAGMIFAMQAEDDSISAEGVFEYAREALKAVKVDNQEDGE